MDHPLVSIVIPAYNVSQYLTKALDSACGQTYEHIQIIVINDGSTDNTLTVAETYKAKDHRIVLIDKKNCGISAARNSGIQAAKGEYIFFLDADDYIDLSTIETLMRAAKAYDAKLVGAGVTKIYPDGHTIEKYVPNELVFHGDEAIHRFFTDRRGLTSVVWDSLYHRSVFDHLGFEEGRMHEDAWFKCKAYYYAKDVVVLPTALYYYVQQREGSIMTLRFGEKNVRDVIACYEDRIVFFRHEQREDLEELATASYYRKMLSFYYMAMDKIDDLKVRHAMLDEMRKRIRDGRSYVRTSRHLSKKWKRKYYVFCYLNALAVSLYKIRHTRRTPEA